MSYEILTLEPEFGLEESIDFRTLVTEMEDGKERRRSKWNYGIRRYKLRLFAYLESAMNTIWDFYIARKGGYDPFLVKIPTEYVITGEAIGTGDGVATDFVLDEFPVDTTPGSFTMYVNGTPTAATLVNNFGTEFSYVSFAAPPAAVSVITGDYEFFFYMRFESDRLTRELVAYQLLSSGMDMKEVTWLDYRPRAGNSHLKKGSTYDNILITESVTVTKTREVVAVDTISINESVNTATTILHALAIDYIGISESVSAIPTGFFVSVHDNISVLGVSSQGTS